MASPDRGMQAERTALSWTRAGLLLTINALLALRTGWESGSIAYTVVAATLFVAAAAVVGYGGLRKRQLLNASPASAPPNTAMAAIAMVTLFACLSGTISTLIER